MVVLILVIISVILALPAIIALWGPTKGKERNQTGNSKNIAQKQKVNDLSGRGGPCIGVNRIPADMLINSRFYSRYSQSFYLLWYEGRNYPRLAYEMLLWSLEQGRELENNGYYLTDSIREGLPYFCETEREYDKVGEVFNPRRGEFVNKILDLEWFYGSVDGSYNEKMSHPMKLKYWKQKLERIANGEEFDPNDVQGSASRMYEAQACIVGVKTRTSLMFSGDERQLAYQKWGKAIEDNVESASPNFDALVAYAAYMVREPYESIGILEKALELSYDTLPKSNAWYWMARKKSTIIALSNSPQSFGIILTEEEKSHLWDEYYQCTIQGAYCNNGIYAGKMQYDLADWYLEGAHGLPKDYSAARYWYSMAGNNGINVKYALETLQRMQEKGM